MFCVHLHVETRRALVLERTTYLRKQLSYPSVMIPGALHPWVRLTVGQFKTFLLTYGLSRQI